MFYVQSTSAVISGRCRLPGKSTMNWFSFLVMRDIVHTGSKPQWFGQKRLSLSLLWAKGTRLTTTEEVPSDVKALIYTSDKWWACTAICPWSQLVKYWKLPVNMNPRDKEPVREANLGQWWKGHVPECNGREREKERQIWKLRQRACRRTNLGQRGEEGVYLRV